MHDVIRYTYWYKKKLDIREYERMERTIEVERGEGACIIRIKWWVGKQPYLLRSPPPQKSSNQSQGKSLQRRAIGQKATMLGGGFRENEYWIWKCAALTLESEEKLELSIQRGTWLSTVCPLGLIGWTPGGTYP